jgi:hypothetical protein
MFDINVVPMLPAVPRLNGEFHAAVSGIQGDFFIIALLGFMIRGCHFSAPWCRENSG